MIVETKASFFLQQKCYYNFFHTLSAELFTCIEEGKTDLSHNFMWRGEGEEL
jgi:hypothetical protein